ncbi:MAG: sulfotransferase family 2 domain-containing protein [Pseudomonadota bacterium]
MVLVSHTHRFIFFKSRKTASTSVEAYFEPFCLPADSAPSGQFRDEYIGPTGIIGCRRGRAERAEATWEAHMRASKILRLLGPLRFFRYFRFTTVRNPFAKYLSAFRYRMRNHPEILGAPFTEQHRAFNAWMQAGEGHPRDKNTFTIGPIRVANAYIRSEHLTADMAAVCEKLNLPLEAERLPHFKKMAAPDHHYSDYFDETSRNIVARRHAWEIETFGYSFRGDAPPAPAPSTLPQGETS